MGKKNQIYMVQAEEIW